jgi:MerR family mercuric resistance operon transcriptional regulator
MQEGFLSASRDIAIGELSRRTQCNIETIRYYERAGLLPKARREKGGRFRRYDADDIARLRFIRRSRQLGFTLDEVRALLRLAAALLRMCGSRLEALPPRMSRTSARRSLTYKQWSAFLATPSANVMPASARAVR